MQSGSRRASKERALQTFAAAAAWRGGAPVWTLDVEGPDVAPRGERAVTVGKTPTVGVGWRKGDISEDVTGP